MKPELNKEEKTEKKDKKVKPVNITLHKALSTVAIPDGEVVADEEDIEEELVGHKIVCTCHLDPRWCEKHGGWY